MGAGFCSLYCKIHYIKVLYIKVSVYWYNGMYVCLSYLRKYLPYKFLLHNTSIHSIFNIVQKNTDFW